MSFTSQLEHFENSDLWGYHILVDNEEAEKWIDGNDRRVICILNGQAKIHAALMHLGNKSGYFININKKVRDQLGLVQGQIVEVVLEKDTSEYGLPMSEELQEILNQDEKGNALFHKLTKGKQRTLIYWVGNVKNPDIRIRRGLVMMNHLKTQPEGKPDFKALNAELKEANQQARMG